MYDFLLIDANIVHSQKVAARLRTRGSKVWISGDVDGGFEQAQKLKPDIIILDQFITESESLALLRRLRDAEATRTTPIVMIAARPHAPTKVRAFWEGVQDYMAKPLDADELWHMAVQLIDNRVEEQA